MADFTTMATGRELDALVAEKVMGCGGGEYGENCQRTDCSHVRDYSTSIAAAWEVVARLERVPIGLSSRMGDSWRLVKTFHGPMRLDVMTPGGIVEGPEADTAPLAICRAALKAVQKE